MKFELKSVKYFASQSHETHCFQATLYVDGVKTLIVSNDGYGGCDRYDSVKAGQSNPNAIAADLDAKIKAADPSSEFAGLEVVVCELVNEHLVKKEFKKALKRVLFVDEKGVSQLKAQFKPTPDVFQQVKKPPWWKPSYVLLNELPEAKAFELFKQHAR